MRSKTMGFAATLGLVILAGQAMAQGEKNQPPSDRSAGPGAASGIDVKSPNASDPNLNNPTNNPATTTPNLNNPNAAGDKAATDPNAGGRTDAGVRTDQAADQGRRDDRSAERRGETNGRTDERGRDDIQWRYRFYNGVWWYWTPNNRWVYWSNNAWQDYNPTTVQYQYEYDRSGRPIRYRAGYRGAGEQGGKETSEKRPDAGRLDANRTEIDKTQTDKTQRDADAKPTGPIAPFKKDADRADRDKSSDKEKAAGRPDDKTKSGEGGDRGDRSKSDDSKREKSSDSKNDSK